MVLPLLFFDAESIFLLSSRLLDIGFSHQTLFPNFKAEIAISAWVSFGVQTETRSTFGSFTTSSQLLVYLENPRSVAL